MGALFGFTGPPDRRAVRSIDAALRHRARGRLAEDEHPVATLAVRARSAPGGGLPGGEGLRRDGDLALALAGHLFEPKPHPEVLGELLERYRAQGLDFVHGLRGAFVLALRDGDVLHLVRDPAGERTLYYGRHEGRLYFAAEPRGVFSAPGFPRRLRPGAVAQYLTFSFVPDRHTILEDVWELPAGHTLTWPEADGPAPRRYFFFESPEREEDVAAGTWTDRFGAAFKDAVAERLPRGEPVGLYLSGGIDSSVVAAEAAALHDAPVKSYAIHFGEQYTHELDFARAVAERCGTDHQEVLVRPRDFLPSLRRMIWHLGEPIGDPITMPNYELSRRVSREVGRVLNGEGGDPLFGGPKNLPMMLRHWYGGADGRDRARWYLASFQRCYDELPRLLTPEFAAQYDEEEVLEQPVRAFLEDERIPFFLHRLLAMNIRLKGAHLILPKVERMTGAWGLQPMSPLFDDRLVRLSFAMPPALKLCHGQEKVVLKRAFRDRLPTEVLTRPKSGMRVPVHYWFKGELKRYARHLLSPKALKAEGIFNPRRVRQLLRYDTEEGRGRYGLRLWMLLTFEIWRRQVIENEPV